MAELFHCFTVIASWPGQFSNIKMVFSSDIEANALYIESVEGWHLSRVVSSDIAIPRSVLFPVEESTQKLIRDSVKPVR